MIISGVYQIQSKIKSERIYIGSAVDIYKRWSNHISTLKRDNHPNKKIQRHYNKYDKDDLVFSVLIECEKHQLIQFEQYYLDFYHPYFNECKIAGSCLGRVSPLKGKKLSEETKIKMSNSRKGRIGWNKGKTTLDETRKKISDKLKGRIFSKEHRQKISNNQIGNKNGLGNKSRIGQIPWNKDKKASEQTRNKLSKCAMGNKNWLGKHHSEETKRKISESKKRRFNKNC